MSRTNAHTAHTAHTAPGPKLTSTLSIGPRRRRAYIVDDLVAPTALPTLFQVVRALPYSFTDYDTDETSEVRHLVHNFREGTPFGRTLAFFEESARTILADNGHRAGDRIRAYANFNLFGDYQFAHVDGDEWTALVFANDRWDADWGGELLLYDDTSPRHPAWAIGPEPGRMVVFDGLILHRGGVPSKLCVQPRISIAIKLRRGRPSARRGRAK